MKKILPALILLLTAACQKEHEDIMDIPIKADGFHDMVIKINEVCAQVNNTVCGYIKGPVNFHFPKHITPDYLLNTDEAAKADELYKTLNNKTPKEIIEEYKKILKNNLNNDMERDKNVSKILNGIKKTYDETKKYAKDVTVKDISAQLGEDNLVQLNFTIENKTPFNILQFSGETEFYTSSDILLTRSKAWTKKIEPWIPSGSSARVNIIINSIPEEDIIFLHAAHQLITKVIVTSLHTVSNDDKTAVLILSLPYSYNHLREVIKERERANKEAVKKINNLY
ncbi:MAG: hypothetical protein K2N67_07300 [Mucispirillum sp.]|nr:hypothetical protein [Mucispirillum sp.]